MDAPCTILDDHRSINAVWFDGEHGAHFQVGYMGVEQIVAYGEPGEFMMLPWFAVYKAGAIYARVPAQCVTVEYAPETDLGELTATGEESDGE